MLSPTSTRDKLGVYYFWSHVPLVRPAGDGCLRPCFDLGHGLPCTSRLVVGTKEYSRSSCAHHSVSGSFLGVTATYVQRRSLCHHHLTCQLCHSLLAHLFLFNSSLCPCYVSHFSSPRLLFYFFLSIHFPSNPSSPISSPPHLFPTWSLLLPILTWFLPSSFSHHTFVSFFLFFCHSSTLSCTVLQGEANSRSASQEITFILSNSKVHYSVHRRPPLVPILNQINPFHTSHCFFKVHLIAFHLRVTTWSLPFRFYDSNVTCSSNVPIRSTWFVHPMLIWLPWHIGEA
jgi:hypothetical protein